MTEEALRKEIEELKRENNAAREEANGYKDKYDVLLKKVDTEINKRVKESPSPAFSCHTTQHQSMTDTTNNIDVLSSIRQEVATGAANLNALEQRWSYVDYHLSNCLYRLNKLEQYSKIPCLLFKGFPLIPEENKHGRALKKFLVSELNKLFPNLEGGAIEPSQIEFGHMLKTRKANKHVVIIKFSCRFTRNAIFYGKKHLPKDCGVSISEHLTYENLQLLNEVRDLVGVRNAWTSQTKIFAKVNDTKWVIQSHKDIEKLRHHISPNRFPKQMPIASQTLLLNNNNAPASSAPMSSISNGHQALPA